jgi:high-affinity Fe2+/Pb2+ permease
MKKLILPALLMLTFEASSIAGWFTRDDHQNENLLQQQILQEQQREQQLQQHNTTLTAIVVVLGVGCIITFVAGTMIGSKTRRAANEN